MAKVQLKSDNINPFGGIFPVLEIFKSSGIRQLIDSQLGKRGKTDAAFSYAELFASIFVSYLCGGDCIEDVMSLKSFWDGHGGVRIASSDTIGRAFRKLSEDNIEFTSDKGVAYAFNTADKLNVLLLKMLKKTGQIGCGDCVNLDFDHQFIPAEKKDAKYSYKKAEGYFPGVASVGGLIVGIENRDGNANVRFHQKDTLQNIIERLESECKVLIQNFRADCGSYSEEIIDYIKDVCEHFYIRAAGCESLRTKFMEYENWEEVTIDGQHGGQHCGVTSFPFEAFLKEEGFRLVVQRTDIKDEYPDEEPDGIFGKEYVYRCIVTSDWSSPEKDIIEYYNKRGASERNFDCQNNDFGWSHLPFSFLKENTVFLLVTAMLKNFYMYLLDTLKNGIDGIDMKCRLKRFIRHFMIVPAKWIKSGRCQVLNLYTKNKFYLDLCSA